MDTTKLKVGQKVLMQSGNQFKEAVVSAVSENCIEVEPVVVNERGYAIQFDKSGKKQLGSWDDPRPSCGEGCKPWELVETVGEPTPEDET